MESIADTMNQGAVSGEGTPVAAEEEKERIERLNNLGQSLAKTRSAAIGARQTSGIEQEWLEDEEFYQGIDDANRHEFTSTWRRKPPTQGGADSRTDATRTTRSTVVPNITRPYVDAASARIADMLLPTDDRGWSIQPTPIPTLVDTAKGKFPPDVISAAALKHPGDPDGAMRELQLARQAAEDVLKEAKAKAEKAQKRIEDWHVECQFHAHVRQVIEDAARIGTGVLKGPVPMRKSRVAWNATKKTIEVVSEIKPGSKWIDPWNFYPDPACGDNIHNGSYTWERDFITKKQLRELIGKPGYIDSQILLCLQEGAHRAIAEEKPGEYSIAAPEGDKDKYEIWYFHGTAERDDLMAAGVDIEGIEDPHLPVMIEMVNNRVIKATLNPLDTGDFPYDVMVWQRRSGYWAGIGVARQIRTPQRIVTGATRNLMDNAGLAGGPMLVFRQGVVKPADGRAAIVPRKIWYIAQDAEEMVDATKAIGTVKVDMLVNELMQIIQLGLKLAEDVTGLPMLLQGQSGSAPDTLGGMQLLNNNASAVLRRLARLFDDRVTEPHVRRYYVWLLLYGEEDEKGDYCIDARGSSALVERDLQNQAIAQMGSLILDPRFGKDPKKWMDEYLKSQRLDPARFAYDDEQWQQIVENMAKGPQDPRMAIAQLQAEFKERAMQLEQQFEEQERAKDRALEAWLATLEKQGTREITLEEIKAKLADTLIKTGTQRALSARDDRSMTGTQHVERPVRRKPIATPPTEPAGRAEPGRAYEH